MHNCLTCGLILAGSDSPRTPLINTNLVPSLIEMCVNSLCPNHRTSDDVLAVESRRLTAGTQGDMHGWVSLLKICNLILSIMVPTRVSSARFAAPQLRESRTRRTRETMLIGGIYQEATQITRKRN